MHCTLIAREDPIQVGWPICFQDQWRRFSSPSASLKGVSVHRNDQAESPNGNLSSHSGTVLALESGEPGVLQVS